MKHTSSNENFKRTSRYSANRRNFLSETGLYTYYRWDEDLKQEVPVNLVPGEDGVTEDWVILLDEIDHDEDLGDRYEDENRSDRYVNGEAVSRNTDGETFTSDAAPLAAKDADPFDLLFAETNEEDPQIAEVLRQMEKLTPAQIDLIYALYGEMRYATDIAAEEGVTEAAIRNRRNKILNRLKKLMEQPD